MLLGFLIGDGGAYMRSWGYVIGLYQSHRAFLVGWSQALDYYGFGALSITSSPIAESVVGNRVVTSTRMSRVADGLQSSSQRRGGLQGARPRVGGGCRETRPTFRREGADVANDAGPAFFPGGMRDWNAEESDEAAEAEEDG